MDKSHLLSNKISQSYLILFFFINFAFSANAATSSSLQQNINLTYSSNAISSNPAAVNITPGNGMLQKYLEKKWGIQNNHGIHFDGAWVGDTNDLFSGGIHSAKHWTSNSSLLLSLTVDTQKLVGWEGGLLGAQFLQFNGQATNRQAGVVQGYNSLPGPPPLNRSELYQLWYRQALFDEKLNIRIGKTVPTFDFNNVVKPVSMNQAYLSMPAVTSLIYTPIFVNPSLLGVLPGYYNSAYGITLNFTPVKSWYLSVGSYDGHLAEGKQTGLKGPNFNGSYFHIGETGFAWLLGKNNLPGTVGMGLWHQTGLIRGFPQLTEKGASGTYMFGSQRLWYKNPGIDDSGLSAFYQYGINNSNVLPMTQFVGAGLTTSGLIFGRISDSMGVGSALSWLNQRSFHRETELMFQAYYQAQIMSGIYFEPVLSFIPTPGATPHHRVWAGTARVVILF